MQPTLKERIASIENVPDSPLDLTRLKQFLLALFKDEASEDIPLNYCEQKILEAVL